MRISKSKAMMIVSQINSIIDQKINIINEEGIIIGSTDEERLNTFHEGAKRVIDRNLSELIVYENDDYEGSKRGVNFPIIVHDQIIGVIGITGDYHEVAKFGQIIKRMTEILVLDSDIKEQQAIVESVKNRFLTEWLMDENKTISKLFVERGLAINVDITIPRRIMVISTCDELYPENRSIDDLRDSERIERKIKNMIVRTSPDNLFFKLSSYLVCAVTMRPDDKMYELAETIKKTIETNSKMHLTIGIDSQNNRYTMAHSSYKKALKAVQSSVRTHKHDIRFYNDINIEIFLDDISVISKQEYVQELFKGYTQSEIAEIIAILEIYYDLEGSITAVAERLHMHKNTLQNRLKKVYEHTGYDPRSIKYSSIYIIATYFYRDISSIWEA
ncbi:MAG TPA: sugar diacid recognition domain-containing protein [Mobilitalea sp.]|nr:sugar diacid recognition domain-containing protein [Mobilitalea sp.]